MDRKTLPINTRDLNTIYSLGTKQEQELHAQTKQIQNMGDVERLEGLQDRDPADHPGDTGNTDNTGGRDNGKGKAVATGPWSVPKTAKGVEDVYQDDLAFIANLPNTPDEKDQMLRRLHRWADAQRAVYQDIGGQAESDHQLARRLQQDEYDTEAQSQEPGPSRFPGSWVG
jgi:hypothetical protein